MIAIARFFIALFALLASGALAQTLAQTQTQAQTQAQTNPAKPVPSRCLAIADAAPRLLRAMYVPVALEAHEVSITFVGHSTFRIESPGGVVIATDYTGNHGAGRLPDVATMNHAHTSHYTDYPDPGIAHVLRGWNPQGGPASHNLDVGDVKIRNVSTDIRTWGGEREKDGNSIFIFETAGLCIGHLGHLHHTLGPEHIGWIGQLDVVMVPVDGGYTMAQDSMAEVLRDLRARLILPMHYFGPSTLDSFLTALKREFPVEIHSSATVVVSARAMPAEPKVLVLPGY